jgi:phospholipid/cholesterol/gamma-HCH transport system permease protein
MPMPPSPSTAPATLTVDQPEPQRLRVVVGGDWLAQPGLPGAEKVREALTNGGQVRACEMEASALKRWNSGLVSLVLQCAEMCQDRQIEFRTEALPPGVQRLLRLAQAVPEKKDARRQTLRPPWLQRVGESGLTGWQGARDVAAFLGESVQGLIRMFRGRAQFRWADAALVMQETGPEALAIVALINFLVGLILAFVGAVQLRQFGASAYVADLVAIGTVREMGCLMTAIIMCGRTGAAFAAQLGTMKVNEEIDAFSTFGFSAVEFLVLPRLLALVLMMPLLVLFADLIAIGGGFVVSVLMLDSTPVQYLDRTIAAISLNSFSLGLVKGSVFGVLVAFTGCLRGIQCGNSAAAVGQATTSAVVTGITAIIVADGVFAVLCNALGI